jgi:hypothetical protein
MMKDIKEAVTQCGHCIVGNNTAHGGQKMWNAISTSEPFDIISMDIWHPGITYNKEQKDIDINELDGALLTSVCNTTAFATIADLRKINSEETARVAFQQIFVPNGLPITILIDPDSVFKGVMIDMCNHLGIKYHVVAAEQHDGILCERFHRYLNKVMRLLGADRSSFQKWRMDVSFAQYAWNAAPVDGTDIIRSFAAKARTFRFPLEIKQDEEIETIIPTEGEASIQHVETMFPLWFQQKELLKLLNDTRRERHREMRNKARTQRIFQPGDLVIVRKQVKSNAAKGLPEKLMLKAKGPYRVIDKPGTDRYRIQRIPTVQGISRRRGKILTESAARMEKLPSSIVIHKRLDTMDTRLTTLEAPLIHNPLEKNLGFFEFGKYTKAAQDGDFAFEKVNQLWNEEVETDDSEEENTEAEESEEPSNNTNRTVTHQETAATGTRNNRLRPVPITRPKTTQQLLKELWKAIDTSKDKLCIIRKADEQGKYGYNIVQIDLEETTETTAKTKGIYHARFYIKNNTDALKKKIRKCKHYPLIRELLKGGWPGAMILVHPQKTEKFLNKNPSRYFWYQDTVNLRDNLISGPFNFETDPMYTIPETAWKELEDKAPEMEIQDLDLNRINPLPQKRPITTNPKHNKRRK